MDENEKKEVQAMIDQAIKMHRHDGVLTQNIYLNNIFGFRNRWNEALNLNALQFTFSGVTNGTTPVSVSPAGNAGPTPAPFQLKYIYLISLDTTAGNITIKNNAATVSTVAKGTTTGAYIPVLSAANITFNPGDTLSIVSSSAGNAFVTFQVLFPFN